MTLLLSAEEVRFNSRLREEATSFSSASPAVAWVSTHASVRRRLESRREAAVAKAVSTHASVRRRQADADLLAELAGFNSRLREEATRLRASSPST